MTRLSLVVLAAILGAGCAHHRVPERADIELVSVSVASSRPGGAAWDDLAYADQLLALAEPSALKLAAADPIGAELIAAGARALRKGIARASLPDPFGTATLVSDEGSRPVALRARSNTCEPEFRAAWRDVKMSRATAVRLELRDADLWGSDPIDSVELTYEDLARAFRARDVATIDLAARGRPVRSVAVVVRRAAKE